MMSLSVRKLDAKDQRSDHKDLRDQWNDIAKHRLKLAQAGSYLAKELEEFIQTMYYHGLCLNPYSPPMAKAILPFPLTGYTIYVVEDDDKTIQGIAGVHDKSDRRDLEAIITHPDNFAEKSSEKKLRGVGKLLLNHIIKEMRDNNDARLFSISSANHSLLFYKQCGLNLTGEYLFEFRPYQPVTSPTDSKTHTAALFKQPSKQSDASKSSSLTAASNSALNSQSL